MTQSIHFDFLRRLASILLLASLTGFACLHPAQATEDAPPQSILFDDTAYQLAFEGNPTPGYRQYAYLPEGEQLPYYRRMLMLEFLVNGVSVEDAVSSQVDFLEQRKQDGDLTVNYRLIQSEASGEYLLDFLSSAQDETVDHIVEWNAYRYAPYTDADGDDGVQIYGYSVRGYGADGGREFLLWLNAQRASLIQTLVLADVPKLGGN